VLSTSMVSKWFCAEGEVLEKIQAGTAVLKNRPLSSRCWMNGTVGL